MSKEVRFAVCVESDPNQNTVDRVGILHLRPATGLVRILKGEWDIEKICQEVRMYDRSDVVDWLKGNQLVETLYRENGDWTKGETLHVDNDEFISTDPTPGPDGEAVGDDLGDLPSCDDLCPE